MKTESKNIPAVMLRVELPRSILVPVTADLNALFRILRDAQVLDSIHRSSIHDGMEVYEGETGYFVKPVAIPSVNPFTEKLHFSHEAAQTYVNETCTAAIARKQAALEAKAKAEPKAA